MKKILPLIIMSIIIIGCKDKSVTPKLSDAESCSVGIFTKSINNPSSKFSSDTLIISSGAKSDFFNDPNGQDKYSNAPMLMKEVDNTKPFTFTAKVKPAFAETYDAGALYIFHDNDLWQKFAFEMDERGLTRLVTVRTIGTSDDNNHDAITADEVFMKIASDTKNIDFYYSLDGQSWQLARLYRNEYPQKVYIALSSQSPIGKGIDTQFSEIEFSDKSIQNFRLGI